MAYGIADGRDHGMRDTPRVAHIGIDKPKTELRRILDRIQVLKQATARFTASNYDISDRCNLTCEGCLFFSGRAELETPLDRDAAQWDAFFRSERGRGINYAYLAGAEPALEPKILEIAARHVPHGVIYTNGSIRIDPDLPYRVHISNWGQDSRATAFRGADVNLKALRNFAGQRRAVVVMTINAQNIDDIGTLARQCSDHGLRLSYSFFSSTTEYLKIITDAERGRDEYSRFSNSASNLKMQAADFDRARAEIDAAAADYPDTVVIAKSFYKWASHDRMPYAYDSNGIARDCGFRLTESFKHFTVGRTEDTGKCCLPNLDCSDCRAYAIASASFLKSKHDHRSVDQMRDFLETWEFWSQLFLPLSDLAAA